MRPVIDVKRALSVPCASMPLDMPHAVGHSASTMDAHPAAALFPMMEPAELRALADDIKAHGQHRPITLHVEGGKRRILDGRNRLAACEMVGVEPRYEVWVGTGSPTEWVVSQNVHRRHLTESQRAMVAAALVPLFEEEAKERQRAGLRQGEAAPVSANLRGRDSGKATEKAAAAVNVSPRSVESALKVTREARPEVVEAVRRGEVAVSAAARDLPKKDAKPRKQKKEEDWPVSLVLTIPRSVLSEVQDSLRALGFKDAGSRRMKFTRRNAA